MAVEGLPGVDAAGSTSCLYTLLSPEERSARRADMKGMPWTDPRDFGMSVEQFARTHVECPVLGGVSRFEYCWERCPSTEPDDRCPRRIEDSSWWWHGSVEPETPQEGAITEAVAPVTPPTPPTPTSPRRRGRRRNDARVDDRGDEDMDVFDLFGLE